MADKKISELDAITGAATAADDFFIVVDTSGSATKKISRAELNNAIEQDVLAQVDITSANIDGGTIDNTPIGATTPSTGDFTTVDTTGDVTVGGNLTVNGTTTTVNSTTLDVDDINITVASGAADAAAADGAGLTVDGASATFNYASSGDKWTMNKPLDVTGTITSDGLTVDGASVFNQAASDQSGGAAVKANGTAYGTNKSIHAYMDTSNAAKSLIYAENGAGSVFNVDGAGDVSLYASDGTTQGFFWDASAQRLGLGTTVPGNLLEISGSSPILEINSTSGVPELQFSDSGVDEFSIQYDTGTNALRFVEGGVGAHMVIKDGGNVGINVTNPAATLDVNGTIKLDGNYPTGSNNVALGNAALDDGSLSGGNNVAIGDTALSANTSGANNVSVGQEALSNNTTGSQNTAVGREALRQNTASNNTALGYRAMLLNSTGSANTAIGTSTLDANTTSSNNTAVGYNVLTANTGGTVNTGLGAYALQANTSGQANTAVGVNALDSNTTASYSTAVGYQALDANTTGASNDAFGYDALSANTTGATNVALGSVSLRANTTGNYNTAVGRAALFSNTTASSNTAVGYSSLQLVTTGGQNTAIGFASLINNTTASNNTAVGYQAGYSNTTGTENTAFGQQALYSNTTGNENHASGRKALFANTIGLYNTASGATALAFNTSGSSNTASGYRALYNNTTASNNTAMGYQAGYSNTTASNNTAVGYHSLYNNNAIGNTAVGGYSLKANTTGTNNAAFGYYTLALNTTGSGNSGFGSSGNPSTLYYNTTGSNNTAMGFGALFNNTTASANTAVGYWAGYSNTNAASNTFVGGESGYNVTTGNSNTFVGKDSGYYVTTGAKNTIVGKYSGNQGGLDIRTSNNYIVLSDGDGNPRLVIDSSGNVGIATTNPQNELDVRGTVEIGNGSTQRMYLQGTGTDFRFYDRANLAERLRITSGGDVGLGTDSPSTYLGGTNGLAISSNFAGIAQRGTTHSQAWLSYVYLSGRYEWYNITSSRTEAYLTTGGAFYNRSGTYGTISDSRLKQDIVDSGSQWDDIKALQVKKYRLNTDVEAEGEDAPVMLGVIAQDLETAGMNGLVEESLQASTDEDGNIIPSDETYKTVKYSILYMKAVKALQEAMDRIETLEAKVAALESN